MEISKETIDSIEKVISKELDTRDKRFMFLKLMFPKLLYRINIEGSVMITTFNIIEEFRKQNMLSSLAAVLNRYLDADIYI